MPSRKSDSSEGPADQEVGVAEKKAGAMGKVNGHKKEKARRARKMLAEHGTRFLFPERVLSWGGRACARNLPVHVQNPGCVFII